MVEPVDSFGKMEHLSADALLNTLELPVSQVCLSLLYFVLTQEMSNMSC